MKACTKQPTLTFLPTENASPLPMRDGASPQQKAENLVRERTKAGGGTSFFSGESHLYLGGVGWKKGRGGHQFLFRWVISVRGRGGCEQKTGAALVSFRVSHFCESKWEWAKAGREHQLYFRWDLVYSGRGRARSWITRNAAPRHSGVSKVSLMIHLSK